VERFLIKRCFNKGGTAKKPAMVKKINKAKTHMKTVLNFGITIIYYVFDIEKTTDKFKMGRNIFDYKKARIAPGLKFLA
jgi:hypothetical protein